MDFDAQEVQKIKSDMGRLIAFAHHAIPYLKDFTWDFVNRTLSMANSIDPAKKDAKSKELFSDVVGRNTLTKLLIHDTTGKTAVMMGRDPSSHVDFGEEVKNAANEL